MCREWRQPPTSLHNLQRSTIECGIRPKIPVVVLCCHMPPVSWAVYLLPALQARTGNVYEGPRRKSEGDLRWVGEHSHATTATPNPSRWVNSVQVFSWFNAEMVHRRAWTTSFGYRLAAHPPPSGLEVTSSKSLSDTSAFISETQ